MKHAFSSLLFLALMNHCTAQSFNFYDQGTIQTIEIFFAQTNWDALMDQQMQTTEDYIVADSVRVNGETFEQVGVKYKGNSSYNANNAKNPLHIELDHIIDQAYQHYTDIKLGNGYSDPSYIREALSYDILKNYMDCPLSNFATVYINGTLMGLYSNDESINKHFLGNHYYSSESEFFKCNPLGGAGPGAGGSPDLTWLGSDSTSYYSRYELKSDYGWATLVDLIDTLNNNTAALEYSLDIDRALWMLAFNNVMVNLDSYSGQFKQNYYLYKDVNGRWVPTVWDLNMSLGGFPGGNLSVAQMQNLTPLYSNDTAHPLIQKLLSNVRYKKMYIAHMRTITNEFFDNGFYLERAVFFRDVIDAAVQSEPNGFYSNAQFQNSLSSNTSGGGGGPGGNFSIPGIQVLMDARNTYLQGTAEFLQVAPTITNVHPLVSSVTFSTMADIQATVEGATSVFLGFRTSQAHRFHRTEMFDDGTHNDGIAGDGIYGGGFLVDGVHPEFYIWAENAEAGAFSPARAEHEFYTLQLETQPLTAGSVVINEVLTSNSVHEDEYGESNDWIELYNRSGSVVDLSGAHLSDTLSDPLRWTFPYGSLIAPDSYLMVWADDDEEQQFYHTNFNLSSIAETLLLTNATGEIMDQVDYPLQVQDISYGRYPNGTGPWTYMETTFGGVNGAGLIVRESNESADSWIAYPNPTSGLLHVSCSFGAILQVEIRDTMGSLLLSIPCGNQQAELDVNNLAAGIYFLTIHRLDGSQATASIVRQ